MTAALISGCLLGLSCGLAPGPLMALVLAQTVRHGTREGCKVACVPLLTDLPVIVVAVAFAAKASQYQKALGVISVLGGAFVLYLAFETFRPAGMQTQESGAPNSVLKGALTNLLSPHPWLFWLTIGATALAEALKESWVSAAVFLALFYLFLVGSKIGLALMAGRSRELLRARGYRIVMGALGMMLAVFALLLFRKGLEYF